MLIIKNFKRKPINGGKPPNDRKLRDSINLDFVEIMAFSSSLNMEIFKFKHIIMMVNSIMK